MKMHLTYIHQGNYEFKYQAEIGIEIVGLAADYNGAVGLVERIVSDIISEKGSLIQKQYPNILDKGGKSNVFYDIGDNRKNITDDIKNIALSFIAYFTCHRACPICSGQI